MENLSRTRCGKKTLLLSKAALGSEQQRHNASPEGRGTKPENPRF